MISLMREALRRNTEFYQTSQNMYGTPQARAPEHGTGPKERLAGPRGMDPLGPVPEYLLLHNSLARGSPNDYFMPFITLLDPNGNILKV